MAAASGIHLTAKKKALVAGRLGRVLRARGWSTYAEYLDALRADSSGRLQIELIDRISTNHTFFYREAEHFRFLQQTALPAWRAAGRRDIRLWCAGCATGEEAYTLALICRDWADRRGYPGSIQVTASDISESALATAAAGTYPADRLRHVPLALRDKYLLRTSSDLWTVGGTLRSLVSFQRLNLMDEVYPFDHPFQAIFCRNVMIYFAQDTKTAVVRRLSGLLESGSYLMIGHAETLGSDTPGLRPVQAALYRRDP